MGERQHSAAGALDGLSLCSLALDELTAPVEPVPGDSLAVRERQLEQFRSLCRYPVQYTEPGFPSPDASAETNDDIEGVSR